MQCLDRVFEEMSSSAYKRFTWRNRSSQYLDLEQLNKTHNQIITKATKS